MKYTFRKNERLSNVRIIARLFKRDNPEVKKLYAYPFRILYIYDSQSSEALPQVVFSISKKNFKKAVDRNLLRRRCREAYRLNKAPFLDAAAEARPSYIAFLFLAKEITSYDVIEAAMKQSIKRLVQTSSGHPKSPNS